MTDTSSLPAALRVDRLPRSSRYDPQWVLENLMGPNVLWLTESLTQLIEPVRGSRVLDLGCGKAVSSIFLAREFGAQVWAVDLWIAARENARRITEQGLEREVFPIHAEAHALHFAEGFFDLIISMDAYHYFGTDDLYLGYITKFLRPGGSLAIAVPGLREELSELPPPKLAEFWEWDFCSFHGAAWWRRHWEKTGLVTVETADMAPDGWQLWLRWLEVCKQHGYPSSDREIALLLADGGENLGFTRVVARRP
jgi:SAM-dependent methyltransferase